MASETRATGGNRIGVVGIAPAIGLVKRGGQLGALAVRLLRASLDATRALPGAVAERLPRPANAQSLQKPKEECVVRFDVHQRVQHVLMFTSFLTLAFTGLPQKFHAWDASQWWIATLGGLEMVQSVHRAAAMVMLFDCVYHGLYLTYTVLIRRHFAPLQMIPMPKDFFDALQMFKYYLGLADEKPRFGRFSYLEKFDYWAVFWGILIIGGSGLVLLFPVQVSQILPGGIVPVALAAHSDESLLAVGWIFIVHFFYAHFAPAIFPFNPSIFTGRVSKQRYAEEHPLEYERLYAQGNGGDSETVEMETSAAPATQLAALGVAAEGNAPADAVIATNGTDAVADGMATEDEPGGVPSSDDGQQPTAGP